MWAVVAFAGLILLVSGMGYLAARKGIHAGLARKLVRAVVGTYIAFWPFFLSWEQIQWLSLFLLITIGVVSRWRLFRALYQGQDARSEVLLAVVIGLLAFLTTEPWIFTVALLHASLADSLATMFGLLWGDHNSYRIFGRTRSLAGSLAFFVCSIAIMVCYAAFSGAAYSSVTVLWLPVAATIAENVAGHGWDSLIVPLFVGLVLTSSL